MGVNRKTELISLRMPTDVLTWFRSQTDRGYQTLIHEVLAKHVAERKGEADRRAGRAQEVFKKYYAQCFWHLNPNLEITPSNTEIVLDGLRKYGGREGLVLAESLCQ